MNSAVCEQSPLQKAIWLVHILKKVILGNPCIPKRKPNNHLKCFSSGTSTSISHVPANCWKQPHHNSSMFPLALPACGYNGAQFLGRSVQIEVGIKYKPFDYH